MKKCFKCEEIKPLSEFYEHAAMADGRLNKCKACTRKDATATRSARLSYYQDYDRRRGRTEERKAVNRERARRRLKADPGWATMTTRNEREKHPDKYRARTKLSNAIRDGKVVRQPCEVCGDLKAHGHHHDYSKPLDVKWLCPKHHGEAHRLYA